MSIIAKVMGVLTYYANLPGTKKGARSELAGWGYFTRPR